MDKRELLQKWEVTIVALVLSLMICACGRNTDPIDIIPNKGVSFILQSPSYSGYTEYEVLESFITDNVLEAQLDPGKINSTANGMYETQEGEIQELSLSEFLNEDGRLSNGLVMYVLHLRVTNIDARYKYYKEDGYDTPYTFSADSLFLNYVNEKGKCVYSANIDYYSERKEGDYVWSLYELPPGESCEYYAGYIVGTSYKEKGKVVDLSKINPLISFSMDGLDQKTEQYQTIWEDRR